MFNPFQVGILPKLTYYSKPTRARVHPDYGRALSNCYCVTRQVKHVPPKCLRWKMLLGAGRYSSRCSAPHIGEQFMRSISTAVATDYVRPDTDKGHRCVIVWALFMKCVCSPLLSLSCQVSVHNVTFSKIIKQMKTQIKWGN